MSFREGAHRSRTHLASFVRRILDQIVVPMKHRLGSLQAVADIGD